MDCLLSKTCCNYGKNVHYDRWKCSRQKACLYSQEACCHCERSWHVLIDLSFKPLFTISSIIVLLFKLISTSPWLCRHSALHGFRAMHLRFPPTRYLAFCARLLGCFDLHNIMLPTGHCKVQHLPSWTLLYLLHDTHLLEVCNSPALCAGICWGLWSNSSFSVFMLANVKSAEDCAFHIPKSHCQIRMAASYSRKACVFVLLPVEAFTVTIPSAVYSTALLTL